MKKIKLYLSILISLAFFSACDQLNDYPEFDDANAFVAFTSERISVKEDADSVLVPIRLTSLAAKSTTVTYEIIDGTALKGREYDVPAGASVLSFDGSKAVMSIKIDILPQTGTFTGDRTFGVIIKSTTGLSVGSKDTAYVTINDLDHPLADILGTYDATATDYFNGSALAWAGTLFEKDPDGDTQKVWITGNILGTSGAGAGSKIYGIVNDDKTEIAVPVHQAVINSSYNAFFDGIDDAGDIMGTGQKVIFEIKKGTVTTIELKEFAVGVLAYDKTTAEYAGYYRIAESVVYTKK